jgi:hypothetical protein
MQHNDRESHPDRTHSKRRASDSPPPAEDAGTAQRAAGGSEGGGARAPWEERLTGLSQEVTTLAAKHRTPLGLGLAASSLALIAGTAGTDRQADVAAATLLEPLVQQDNVAQEPVWDLHVSEHDRIDFFVEFLMGRNHDKTKLWLERLGKYGPFIENELRERGMPLDLIWLATIESGLDNNAYSRAHAAGMWQFIAETGQRYGLEVSRFVDDRRDPIKSTAAALTYLQEMHERFGSWYLAAAGYNTGENRVGRLMRELTGSERGTDEGYWTIWDRLPRETRDYVPLMIAMGHIGKEPAKHGFQEALQFEEVIVPGGTRIADVATAAGADLDEIEELNARFVRGQTPPGRDMPVRVPIGARGAVLASISGAATSAVSFGP